MKLLVGLLSSVGRAPRVACLVPPPFVVGAAEYVVCLEGKRVGRVADFVEGGEWSEGREGEAMAPRALLLLHPTTRHKARTTSTDTQRVWDVYKRARVAVRESAVFLPFRFF